MTSVFVERVVVRNYRSIESCDVALGPLVFLVGPNGSGKSNFLDALRFVSDSLRLTLEHALRSRGGLREVRRRSGGHLTHIGIRLDLHLPDGKRAWYAFEIGSTKGGRPLVKREICRVGNVRYVVAEGRVEEYPPDMRASASPDRLYLVHVSGHPEFRGVYDGLSEMSFFNPVPDVIRRLSRPDAGTFLERDGSNLASLYRRQQPRIRRHIVEYLAAIVPGLQAVDVRPVLNMETFEFRFAPDREAKSWRFRALSMSDGTLRALGVLVAMFHQIRGGPRLVGLEEPEMALHPGGFGVLFDALCDASENRQIVVTTHSPDLLDRQDLPTEQLRAVVLRDGKTVIGGLDGAGRQVLQEELYTPGELLRMDQLDPDTSAARSISRSRLFAEEAA